MAEKRLNTRIIHKHETEANWLLATNFIPMQGEIIIYDIDSTHTYERVKVGDGKTLVSALPFVDANKVDKVSGKGLSTNDYTTTEKNKLAGIAEGANKTVVDSALSTTSTNPVQNKVVNTAISNLNTLVGDKKVSEQISTAIASKADTNHNHDDKYYTESEIDTKLSGKSDTSHNHDTVYAAKSHGNHVPATETANNAKFLRNDNTWQTVTPANIGAAASSHGTHVTFGTDAPKVAGTASVGTATTVSRSDHVHPAQTSITGNAATATKATQDASGNVITTTYATKTELNAISSLVGDKSVSTQIENAHKNVVTVAGGGVITMESEIGAGPYDIEITTDEGELDWIINTGVATGGTTGQILVKKSNTDFDTSWVDAGAYVGVKVYTATIGTTWTENVETGVKSQTVAINGINANHTAKVDVVYSGNGTSASYATFVTAKNQFLDYITNGYAETVSGGVKFNIFGDPNTVTIPIIVEVV